MTDMATFALGNDGACTIRFKNVPDLPIPVFVGRQDRFFPADFHCRVVRERFG